MIFFAAFILGAVIGSFLNVLVYRLPEGMSLVSPASHCPKCGHPIRPYDNIPILGWLILHGRCRDCQESISARYPIVELVTALLFVAVAVAEQNALSAAAAHSESSTRMLAAEHAPVELPPPDYFRGAGRFFYRAFLVSGLWAALLIQLDGNRIPWRFFLVMLLVGCLLPVLWPSLHPIPVLVPPIDAAEPVAERIKMALGLIPGLGLLAVTRFLKARPLMLEATACLAVSGAFLGFHAAVVLGGFLLLDFLILLARGKRSLPLLLLPTAWLLLGSLSILFSPPLGR